MSDLQTREFIGRGPWSGVGRAFKQTLAGQSRSPALYATPDGLEIELYSPIDIQRLRIFFADIRMVALATRTDWGSAVVNGAFAAIFALAALFVYLAAQAAVPSSGILAVLAVFVVGMVLTLTRMVRAISVSRQVISIYGRRLCIEWAKVPTPHTIQERYAWLVSKVREANAAEQARVAALRLAAKPPPPPEIPQPELPPAEGQEAVEVEPLS
jgi:hypothetical protein